MLKVYEESMEGNKQSDKDLWMPAMKKFNEQCEKIGLKNYLLNFLV